MNIRWTHSSKINNFKLYSRYVLSLIVSSIVRLFDRRLRFNKVFKITAKWSDAFLKPDISLLINFAFQLYDFISSKCLGSLVRPPKDAYFRYREILDILRDIDDSYSFANNDTLLKRIVHELLEILTKPHFKVSHKKIDKFENWLKYTIHIAKQECRFSLRW